MLICYKLVLWQIKITCNKKAELKNQLRSISYFPVITLEG